MIPLVTTETIVERVPGILGAVVGDSAVLLNAERGIYCGLDEIGTEIWNRLDQPVAVGSLCDTLAVYYDADLATIREDVIALLTQLAEAQVVRIA